jgi:hypothetical protein
MLTPRQRLVAALDRQAPDRLPVTTHHVMPFFLNKYMGGMDVPTFFQHFGLDPIVWAFDMAPNLDRGEYWAPIEGLEQFGAQAIQSDTWRITGKFSNSGEYPTTEYTIHTPGGNLVAVLQSNEHTTWTTKHMLERKEDIELIGNYMTMPLCDTAAVNRISEATGQTALVRGCIPSFEISGQPGCWQDASCLYGIEALILETFSDPEWVHALLQIIQRRKLAYVASLKGANYDVLEFGGGDASCTVISPKLFKNFVSRYDEPVIKAAQEAGQRIVYHTCGGMMAILELLAEMHPNACETLTPAEMGGDMRLAEAKRRIGDKMCMIGGFDQFHHFVNCTEAETRAAVRRCFEQAGEGGGFILSPSDHFFDADPALIMAFADEARKMSYN